MNDKDSGDQIMKITAEQRKAVIKIIEDIVEQAREQRATAFAKNVEYKYSTEAITREALENFEDELKETTP